MAPEIVTVLACAVVGVVGFAMGWRARGRARDARRGGDILEARRS